MNIDTLEKQLDELIENDPKFGEWYFSKEKNMLLPRDAYEKYQQALSIMTTQLTIEVFKHKMIMRKNGWDEVYLEKEIQRIRDVVDSQYGRQTTCGFGDNDYVKHFRGVTNYFEVRAAVLRYKELLNTDIVLK
jgi:hypothetical protein